MRVNELFIWAFEKRKIFIKTDYFNIYITYFEFEEISQM